MTGPPSPITLPRIALGALLAAAAGTVLTAARPGADRPRPADHGIPSLVREPRAPGGDPTPVPSIVLGTGGSRVTAADFSPRGDSVLTGSREGDLRIFDLGGGLLHDHAVPGHVRGAAFSPDGRLVLLATGDSAGILIDPRTGTRTLLPGHDRFLWDAAFSPDGRLLATASYDHTARIWRPDGTPAGVLRGHGAVVLAVAFSPAGDRVLTLGGDGTARVFATDGSPVATFGPPVGKALWDAEGSRVLLLSGAAARLADPGGGPGRTLDAGRAPLSCAAVDPAGGGIFLGDAAGNGRLFAPGGTPGPWIRGHGRSVNAAVFLRDGAGLLTASADGTLRTWDGDGRPRSVVRGLPGWVQAVRLSPDGTRVLVRFASELRMPPRLLAVRDLLGP